MKTPKLTPPQKIALDWLGKTDWKNPSKYPGLKGSVAKCLQQLYEIGMIHRREANQWEYEYKAKTYKELSDYYQKI